jgi:hypothetical protein
MKPRHSAEQSTTTVNKAQVLGKRGFAVLRDKEVPKIVEEKVEAPAEVIIPQPSEIKMQEPVPVMKTPDVNIVEDPQEKFLCESCQ